jgi:hypothetical protein
MSCEFAHNDGAYVLGALAPAERSSYERHLSGCASCREAVAAIAVLPGLLSRLAPLQAQEPPAMAAERLPKLVETANRLRAKERIRQRWQIASSAFVAAAVVMAIFLPFINLRGDASTVTTILPSGPPMFSMTQAVETTVTAEISFVETRSGVEVVMHCAYPWHDGVHKPYTFRLFALGTDGQAEQLGSWMAAPGDDVTVSGTSRYHLTDLIRLELRSRDGTTLLAYDLP